MKTVLVVVDVNDGDYIKDVVNIPKETFEKFLPLIEKIKNFKPYKVIDRHGITWAHCNNFPCDDACREDLGEKTPMELYGITEAEFEEFRDAFHLWGDDYGLHTIVSIKDVTLGTEWL